MLATLVQIVLTVCLAIGQVPADSGAVQLGQVPAWTLPPPAPSTQPAADTSAVRVIYSDNQTRVGPNGSENFHAYRLKVLKPEGLAAGNLTLAWNPGAGHLTVHRFNIIRGTQVTDVLKSTRFQVLQREGGLEQAMLDGRLTAAIQAPGLEVGDELEFAATVTEKDPTLGSHTYGIAQLPVIGQPGVFRARVIWPVSRPLKWKTTSDLAGIVAKTLGNHTELLYEISDPKSAIAVDNAPLRFNFRRQIEYSDYNGWDELSQQLWSLYDTAAKLEADSPLRQEAGRIAAMSSEPGARAIAALRLVQERVRYVYVGLNGGNFRPATADETWKRRFGDCKAKTVLLLALLRELGVSAEAALVNTGNGDGIDVRLPNPTLFDHVLVHATIAGKSSWLDGTALGNVSLANLPAPLFRWALPVRAKGAALMAVPLEPPANPQLIEIVDLDVRAGFDRAATIKVQRVLRGQEIAAYRATLSSLPSAGAERALKNYWSQAAGWSVPETVAWRYDERQEVLILSMTGETKPEWDGNDNDGRSLDIPGAGFSPPSELRRSKDQDSSAPWITEFPRFSCWATTIHLPVDAGGWRWTYRSAPVDRKLGGVAYWRFADLRDNVMRTVMSKRFYLPEISAEQAAEVNAGVRTFDNKISKVYQVRATEVSATAPRASVPPFDDKTDWVESPVLCASPKPFSY